MAANQRRKLSNGAANVDSTLRGQSRAKRKRVELVEDGLNTKSHISLQWDVNQARVIAKKEQIGISWRDLKPFVDSLPHGHNILADAFDIPREIFDLENLKDVLSQEAWRRSLSESERNFLMQFLPREAEAKEVVKSVLSGDNFHFGNPLFKWGASLQSGNLHPDAVVRREQHLKAEKKEYYSELKKYHNDIIGCLVKLKESWESCKDPEKEFVQKIPRSKKNAGKKFSSPPNGSIFRELEESVSASSEFSSWDRDERSNNSDKHLSAVMKGVVSKKRMGEKGKGITSNSLAVSDNVPNAQKKPKKVKKLSKSSIIYNDGAKYMSFIKISKKQHELAKSMERSGAAIHSKSLRPLLGNLDEFNIQPYEVFVEEERKKLHEHWVQLAKEDVPSTYASWRNLQEEKHCMVRALEQELNEKVDCFAEGVEDEEETSEGVSVDKNVDGEHNTLNMENEKESLSGSSEDQNDNTKTEFAFDGENDEEPELDFSPDSRNDQATGLASITQDDQEPICGPVHDLKDVGSVDNISTVHGDRSPVHVSSHNTSMKEIAPPIDCHDFNHLNLGSVDKRATSRSDNGPHNGSFSGTLSRTNIMAGQGLPLSSGGGNIWQPVSMLHPFYNCNTGPQGTSSSELKLTHTPVNNDQRGHWMDVECNLHQQSNEGSLKSYPNPDQNELLQSILKGQDMMSYSQEQKPTELHFAPSNSVLIEDSRFPSHFHQQSSLSMPLEQVQKTGNDVLYMQQNMSDSIFPDGGRYLFQRPEQVLPVNVQDWAVNPVRMPDTLQPPLIGGDLSSQNWFSGERHVRGGWTSSGTVCAPSQSIGSASNLDQGLYSVLSHCNQLRPSGTSYDAIGSAEQFIPSRNYALVGGPMPSMSNVLPPAAHPLDYMNRREPATSLMPTDTGWINLPHQNSSLNDSMGKPFLGSWNQ
ncbi:uncharacterized protein LOC115747506 isoform X2 [Rhodamnia argentea]|uniref:Uncharacterized protein LOC115747506 isoform X2 n=1 Tax=Rhodamnia argentea TaxID=178133 RepID=A0A8B8PXM5_9MYRT|nr:uncharacterized protein LOC115747506 isoform X2 [Rhodamnia argentea]